MQNRIVELGVFVASEKRSKPFWTLLKEVFGTNSNERYQKVR